MNDFVGNELKIGDRVVYHRGTARSRLTVGTVIRFCPKTICVVYTSNFNNKTNTYIEHIYPFGLMKITEDQYKRKYNNEIIYKPIP